MARPSQPARGPRTDGADVRRQLLDAGQVIYSDQGFDDVSLRQVAERAGVNQAMVRYYFRDKHGFLAALIDDGFDALLEGFPAGAGTEDALRYLLGGMARRPWLGVLMLRTVYASDELRAHFAERHVPRMLALMRTHIFTQAPPQPEQALALIATMVFPQIAGPLIHRVLGISIDTEFIDRYAHQVSLMLKATGGIADGA